MVARRPAARAAGAAQGSEVQRRAGQREQRRRAGSGEQMGKGGRCGLLQHEGAGTAAGRPAASVWEQARYRSRGCSRGVQVLQMPGARGAEDLVGGGGAF